MKDNYATNIQRVQTSVLVRKLKEFKTAYMLSEQHEVEGDDGYAKRLFLVTKKELENRAPHDKTAFGAVNFFNLI